MIEGGGGMEVVVRGESEGKWKKKEKRPTNRNQVFLNVIGINVFCMATHTLEEKEVIHFIR